MDIHARLWGEPQPPDHQERGGTALKEKIYAAFAKNAKSMEGLRNNTVQYVPGVLKISKALILSPEDYDKLAEDISPEYPFLKLEQYLQFPITRLKPPHSFEYLFYEYAPPRKNPALEGLSGLSWPGPQCRWCTARLKTRIIDRYLRELKKEFEVVQYIGIAADEQERVREFQYPLVEWEMAEADCLAYCRARGFDWGGLYDLFRRVSCWCCPLQPLSELRTLRKHFPELWEKLRYMDAHTWRQFRADYSVEQLEQRFALEEERAVQGLPLKGRDFYAALKNRLGENAGETGRSL